MIPKIPISPVNVPSSERRAVKTVAIPWSTHKLATAKYAGHIHFAGPIAGWVNKPADLGRWARFWLQN